MSENTEEDSKNIQSLQEELNDQNTLFEITRNAFEAILQTSPIVDRFSSWLLIGCGATASLLIAHIDTIKNYLFPNTIKPSLLILVIAGLFGLLQKHIAFEIKTNLSIIQNLWPKITTIVSEYTTRVDETNNLIPESIQKASKLADITDKFKNQFKKSAPFYSRNTIDKYAQSSKNDPLYVYKISIKLYHRQRAYFLLELISFFLVIILIAFRLK